MGPVECATLSLRELHKVGKMKDKERFRRYRKCFYEAGAVDHQEKKNGKKIEEKVLQKERGEEKRI